MRLEPLYKVNLDNMSTTKFKNNLHVTGTITADGTLTSGGLITDSNSNTLFAEVPATATVLNKTADYPIVAADFGKVMTNTGDSGAIVFTLPAASTVAGKVIKFAVLAAHQMSVSPAATDAIFLNGSGEDNKDLVIAGVVGNSVTIRSNGTNYEAYFANGVVTKEA